MRRGVVAASLFAASAAAPALAQSSPLLIERGRIDQAPAAPDAQAQAMDLRGRISIESDETAPAPFAGVAVAGASIDLTAFQAAAARRLGAPLDRALVGALANDLNRAYQASDVALFTILAPAQDLSDGELDLVAIEGHVSAIDTERLDASARDIARLSELNAPLRESRPLSRSALERALLNAQAIPGLDLEARFAPAPDMGGARLVLAGRQERFEGGFGISNRGTPRLGDTQISFDSALFGLARSGDSTRLTLIAPAEDDLFNYVRLDHATPLGARGAQLALSASRLETRPAAGVSGAADTRAATFSYPLMRGFARTLDISLGIDALDSKNAIIGLGSESEKTRVIRTGLSFRANAPSQVLGAAGALSFGLDTWGADVDPLRAEAAFTKLTLQASFNRVWRERYVLRLSGAAQFADGALPASEQFALGGDQFGRGYRGGVALGDSGAALSAEAAHLVQTSAPFVRSAEIYAFWDGGVTRAEPRALYSGYDLDFASAGLGARAALGRRTRVGLEASYGLDAPYPAATEDWRVVYTLSTRTD